MAHRCRERAPSTTSKADSCSAACRVYGWDAVQRAFRKLNRTFMLDSGTYGTASSRLGNEAILEEILVSDAGELDLERRRQAMVMIIAVRANLCANEIGKDQLSDRIMQAIASVPRHRFVPMVTPSQRSDSCDIADHIPFCALYIPDLRDIFSSRLYRLG